MNLLEYSSNVVARPSIDSVQARAGAVWRRAYDVLQNESRTDPTVATALAGVVFLTDECERAFNRRGLDPAEDSRRETILINGPNWGQYTLLVADDDLPSGGLQDQETLFVAPDSLDRALYAWKQDLEPSDVQSRDAARLAEIFQGITVDELLPAVRDGFPVNFIRRPRLIATSAPTPAWHVTAPGVMGRATAGCMVEHTIFRTVGVTSVRHFLPPRSVRGLRVDVNGIAGTVAEEDVMSDSVFIELPSCGAPPASLGRKGWLQGIAPRIGEKVEFDGATSTRVVTAVQGQDPGLMRFSPFTQSRVYTPAVTNPGDSGAALVERSSDLIIGFAKDRTEAGADIEWSSWIWADAVMTALNVRLK